MYDQSLYTIQSPAAGDFVDPAHHGTEVHNTGILYYYTYQYYCCSINAALTAYIFSFYHMQYIHVRKKVQSTEL